MLGRREGLGKAGAPHRALQRLALEPARHAAAQVEQLRQVDAGLDAHALEHEHQVFRVDVAAGTRRMRAAADAGQAGVETRDAYFQRGIRIREPHAARVVEMAAPQPVARDAQRALEQAAHHRRIGIADGVGQAHAVGAGVEQRLHQPQHLVGIDMALQRAAEGRAHAAVDQRLRARRVARRADAADFSDHFVRRLAQVGEAVRMAGRQRHDHQVGLARDGAFGALEVGHQHRGEHPRQRLRIGQQFGGVGQLRQQVRGHERTDLDLALAGRVRVADPFELAFCGQHAGDALQAVAQAHFADDRAWRQEGVNQDFVSVVRGTVRMLEVPIRSRRYILEAI